MRDKPLVSIAINNYNYERFLREAIDSALGQTYPHTEVIVVDDGSTDGSREIISSYGERVAAVLKENGGQASAFNAGFAASSGEIVIFLDADDMLLPEAVDRIVDNWRPDLAKIQYLLEVVDEASQLQGSMKPTDGVMPGGDLRELILSGGTYLCSPTSGNAVSRHVLEKILPMPEEGWRISADGYLANLIPFFGEILSLHERLGLYRVHSSNNWAMREIDLKKIRDYITHDLQKQELLKEHGDRMGVVVDDNLALRVPSHVKCRFASLRMDPGGHPCPEDSRWSLARHGIRGCWRNNEFSLRKKVFYSIWFALVALSPKPAFRSLINLGLMPIRRPRLLSFMDVAHKSDNGSTR